MYIELIEIGKEIKKVQILRNINLCLEGGKVYGLHGKNGCGKTMLMRVISGLIRPTSGKVVINGKELWKDITVPESIGLLLENPSFIDEYTGYKNLRILADIKGLVGEEEIVDVLNKVGLDPYDKRKYRKYSLGMKQKLGIACAFMENPDIVILDEPINALDANSVILVRKIIDELKAAGKIIIVACHDADEMNQLADEIYMMEDGMILEHKINSVN